MIRRAVTTLLAACLVVGAIGAQPAVAAPPGSITWTVDHHKKTITARISLQIYSGCSGDPYGSAASQAKACKQTSATVTTDLANTIKAKVESVWNKGLHYKCYRLIVLVDVSLAPDRGHLDPGRIGVRMDPSANGIRSWVDTEHNDTTKWQSNDPADRLEPENGAAHETTWSVNPGWLDTYAHEVGHVLGLHDTYTWSRDANGNITYKDVPGAPKDLMNGGLGVDQTTLDRLVERNGNQMVDADGSPVDLKDLHCEAAFLVDFSAKQNEYGASNLQDSIVDPPCSRAPFTSSTSQDLHVNSDKVEVRVIEDPSLPLGYVLVPGFDVLTLQNGMSGGGRAAGATGLFDVPIVVDMTRFHSQPASGDIPPVFDFQDKPCAGGDGGNGQRKDDCGGRTYRAWIAMSQNGSELWPANSSLPTTLRDLGYSEPRLELLYKSCSGPRPWPGAIADQAHAVKKPGRMPALAALQKVSDDWRASGTPGSLEITGTASVDWVDPGHLDKDDYLWILTLCPLNNDGVPSPDCS